MQDDDEDREARIEALKCQAAAAAGGTLMVHESDELPPEVREEFWRRVVEVENGPTTDLLTELKRVGLEDYARGDAVDGAILARADRPSEPRSGPYVSVCSSVLKTSSLWRLPWKKKRLHQRALAAHGHSREPLVPFAFWNFRLGVEPRGE
jgi:hypothetical protein